MVGRRLPDVLTLLTGAQRSRFQASSGCTSFCTWPPISARALERSWSRCRFSQNSGVVENSRAKRSAVSGVTTDLYGLAGAGPLLDHIGDAVVRHADRLPQPVGAEASLASPVA